MEKRLLLFFGLTFLIVSFWMNFVAPPPERTPGGETPRDATTIEGSEDSNADADTRAEGPANVGEALETASEEVGEPDEGDEAEIDRPVRAAEAEREIVVETSLYRMVLTNRGARMVSMQLNEHRDAEQNPYEMVAPLAAEHLDIRPLDVALEDARRTAAVSNALFETNAPAGRVRVADGAEKSLELVWADGRGLEVEKRLTLVGATYRIGVEISVRYRGEEIRKDVVYVGKPVKAMRYGSEEKGALVSSREVHLYTADAIEEEGGALSGMGVSAAGVAAHYFAGLMVPNGDASYGARIEVRRIATEVPEETDRVIAAFLEAPRSPAGFTLYLGPKKFERLEALAPGMGQIIELGWMRYPALLLRSGLMKIYEYVGNYGWAIVLLTVVINVVLVPLKHYSFVSMRRMQKLSPQIQKIRERYKKVKPTDPRYQHMNQEIMGLYKEHNVSPVSGCLPMLLMIPFFFAFYRLLMASIELRHAPFLFWIQDLSTNDPWFVLPILMGATQMAIQKMTPQTSADPMQAKIMAFMPIMFTVILAWAPSGLVLYWFSNNLVSMAQQLATNRFLKDREEKAAESVKTIKKGKGHKGERGKKRQKSAAT